MRNVVAIDGPAGSGKSTVARRVAEKIGFQHINTGAMYRALALATINSGADPQDEEAVSAVVARADVRLLGHHVLLDGVDVTEQLRMGLVTREVARIASYPAARNALLGLQRTCAADSSIVMEGRDIGTVVFPDARWKFFLDARPDVRAKRRQAELAAQGRVKEFEWVLGDLIARDKEDRERAVAPLRAAADAIVIDSSDMTAEDVVERIVRHVTPPPH